ncbi:hypothetical protein [Vibrio vulnificus YJ016]|uniref:Uncharacterized protein n=1 Tax=Vibrio vulnificus (strain YJ016) TaxID=196600 RepID=Q7MDD8_VIBVY|nr:hypothetical protein [Vibrio vulnificus YJ016]
MQQVATTFRQFVRLQLRFYPFGQHCHAKVFPDSDDVFDHVERLCVILDVVDKALVDLQLIDGQIF